MNIIKYIQTENLMNHDVEWNLCYPPKLYYQQLLDTMGFLLYTKYPKSQIVFLYLVCITNLSVIKSTNTIIKKYIK